MQRLLTKVFRRLGYLYAQAAFGWPAVAAKRGRARVTAAQGGGPLVVVRVDAIGDFVVWLAAAERLVALHRPRRAILIANRIFADLARASGVFEEVLAVDRDAFLGDWRYCLAALRQTRSLGASIAIHPTYSRNFWIGDALIRATAAPERIGYDGDVHNMRPWQKRLSDRWYTGLVSARPEPLHELQRNEEFLRGLGDSSAQPTVARIGRVAELPEALRQSPEYFVIVPGAGNFRRMWPIDRFARLACAVAERHGLRLVVCGSAGEQSLAKNLARQSGLADALVLAGLTSVPELVEIIRRARLVIANDSSAIHIAAAVATPSLCLLGGGHFGRFIPYPEDRRGPETIAVHAGMPCFGCNWRCTLRHAPDGPYPCIEAITLEAAIAAAMEALAVKETP